jgi:hypothetical protein
VSYIRDVDTLNIFHRISFENVTYYVCVNLVLFLVRVLSLTSFCLVIHSKISRSHAYHFHFSPVFLFWHETPAHKALEMCALSFNPESELLYLDAPKNIWEAISEDIWTVRINLTVMKLCSHMQRRMLNYISRFYRFSKKCVTWTPYIRMSYAWSSFQNHLMAEFVVNVAVARYEVLTFRHFSD